MTETLIPGPPANQQEWSGGEEEAFLVLVARMARDSLNVGPVPLTMSLPGAENTLLMFTEREMAEQFVASPTFVEVERVGIVKGAPAEAFIKVLGFCVEDGFVERVMVNPNPMHEWEQGKFEGNVADAAEFLAELKEVYRDFLND
jgi:hypothetical protein